VLRRPGFAFDRDASPPRRAGSQLVRGL